MARFSRNPRRTDSPDLNYETVYQIAVMLLCDKKSLRETSEALDLPYSTVHNIRRGQKQNDLWIDAIAALGRDNRIK